GQVENPQRNLEALKRLQTTGAAAPAEVEAGENQLRSAQAELNLANQQLKSRYSSAEVQRVVAQHAEAQAAYHAARELLQDSNVRAPLAGVVYSLPVRQGQFVNTGDLLVRRGLGESASARLRG